MPEESDIYKVVLAELIESVDDCFGSRTVVVDNVELEFKYRDGVCTIHDEEGEPFVQYKVALKRL